MSATNGTSLNLNSLSYDQMKAKLEETLAQLAAKPKMPAPELQFSVGPKGGICVIGLQGHPVTLYWDQWLKLIGVIKNGRLEAFASAHMHELKFKGE